jgi:PAS domain S-box-containing protein
MDSTSNVVRLPSVPSLAWEDCRLLVESVIDYAIFMLDVEGHVATWNIGAQKIKGYEASEIIGQHFSKFYPVEDIAAGKPSRELELALQMGRVEDEGWRVRKNGSRFWANVIITALRDENGKLRGFGKVTRDMTARRAAEEELRAAEQRFHYLVDAVIDYAIFMLDPAGNVATWNEGARRLKGYAAEEIIGKHFSTFYLPEDRAAERPATILETVRRYGRYEEEGWRLRKDGSRFWVNVVITALRDDRNVLIGFAKVTRDLTERRKTEENLRRSEERFRLLVEHIADYAIYVLDRDGRVVTWNRGAERMKGYKPEEIIGRNFAVFFPEEDVASGKPSRELARALARGHFEDEGWRVRKDGTRFWANAILTALRDDQGSLIGFAKITRDLTARRESEAKERQVLAEQAARAAAEQSERRLRDSEERYRALSRRLEIVFEGVADGITVQDRSGRVVFANRAAATICGFASPEEMVNRPVEEVAARFEILDEDGGPFDTNKLPGQQVLAGEPGSSAVLQLRRRGSRQDWWALVRASAVLGPDGKPELAINIWHDVTATRRQEVQARCLADATAALGGSLDSAAMLSALANVLVPTFADWCSIHLLDGAELRHVTVAHDDPAKLAMAQDYHRRFQPGPSDSGGVWNVVRTGVTERYNDITDELLARTVSEPDRLEALRAVGMKAVLLAPIKMRSRNVGVISLVSADRERRYDESDIELVEELGRRAGVALDNARLYEMAQEAARVAEEAGRTKDEFLATVSHELRTPLNAIVGWSKLLKDRITDPALTKPIEVIHRNAQSQVKIIDDILDVSRVITGKFRLEARPIDLVAVAREAIDVVRPSAIAKNIALDFRPGSEFCFIVADSERLQQVVWNLLSNAVKFTPVGGSIQTAVRHERSNVVLSVTDNGKGIEPDFLPFVFDRFRQADASITRRVGGLGLGLALVRHIVELHGGQVAVASGGMGKGAAFTVTLPIRAVARPQGESPSPPRVSAPASQTLGRLNGLRVLVVDDEPDARDLIATVFLDAGARVETAQSAVEGLQIFKRIQPDILVSDIGMPDEDGFSFMRKIRALSAAEKGTIPSLALTAFATADDRARALGAGYTMHLGKPVDPDALVAAVAKLAANGGPQ